MQTWTIIPVKPLRETKSRLSGVLSMEQRAALTRWMLARTLRILDGVAGLAHMLVVTRDPLVADIAHGFAAHVLPEAQPGGLNLAVAKGVAWAAQAQAARALVLPSDLPLLSATDVEAVLAVGKASDVVLCADRAQAGTNALLLPAGTAFQFQFGPHSFARHCREAARRGLSCRAVALPGLEFDLDTAVDWEFLRRSAATPDLCKV